MHKKTSFTLPNETMILLQEIKEKSGLKLSTIIKQAVELFAKKYYEGR